MRPLHNQKVNVFGSEFIDTKLWNKRRKRENMRICTTLRMVRVYLTLIVRSQGFVIRHVICLFRTHTHTQTIDNVYFLYLYFGFGFIFRSARIWLRIDHNYSCQVNKCMVSLVTTANLPRAHRTARWKYFKMIWRYFWDFCALWQTHLFTTHIPCW